jgi:large subunit ribosomal protein L23
MAVHLYDVIKRPIITESSSIMAGEHNQFMFEVDLKANKHQIKEAIETIFEVQVIKVATLIMPAKRGQRGRKKYMRTAAWKKAIVTLPQGQTIPLFNV